jgi:hypothetical protein
MDKELEKAVELRELQKFVPDRKESCQCEQASCHEGEACSKPPTKVLNTLYGKYKMCNECADKMPVKYLSKAEDLEKGRRDGPEELSRGQDKAKKSCMCDSCGKPIKVGELHNWRKHKNDPYVYREHVSHAKDEAKAKHKFMLSKSEDVALAAVELELAKDG